VPAVHAHNFARTGSVKAVLISDLPPISIGWAFRHWKHLPAAARAFALLLEQDLRKMQELPGSSSPEHKREPVGLRLDR